MKVHEVADFVNSLVSELPPIERFWRLGDLTALRHDRSEGFYRSNYERGILLYALTARHRPQTVLEFGTGRGYGALCMAWAMEDHGISGRIYTIDMVPQDEEFRWGIDRGSGPRFERLARSQVWPNAAPEAWLRRIETLTGRSGQVIERWSGPPVDMAFIDGSHDYSSIRHDFYSMLDVAADRFGVLFDDYSPLPGFGVQRLIDEEVAPHFEAEFIDTGGRWPGGERAHPRDPQHAMVWIDSETLRTPIAQAYPPGMRNRFRRRYRLRDRPGAFRRFLGRTRQRLQR